jgi:acyl-CoA hydrolase
LPELHKSARQGIVLIVPDTGNPETNQRVRTVRHSQSEYSEICLPNDTNTLGNMLGGHVMHLVDLCGAIAATRHARGPIVTASVDQMTFLHPVRVGELLLLKSQVNRVFRTSMEVGVKVWVENLQTGEIKHTSSAYLTFVALDGHGNRVVLPPIVAETEDDRRRYEEAAERRAYRLALKDRAKSKA